MMAMTSFIAPPSDYPRNANAIAVPDRFAASDGSIPQAASVKKR
jgi:hypothetical protein